MFEDLIELVSEDDVPRKLDPVKRPRRGAAGEVPRPVPAPGEAAVSAWRSRTIRTLTVVALGAEAALFAAYAYFVAPLLRDGIFQEGSGGSDFWYAVRLAASAVAIGVCLWACAALLRRRAGARPSVGVRAAAAMNLLLVSVSLVALVPLGSGFLFPVFTAAGAVVAGLCVLSLRQRQTVGAR